MEFNFPKKEATGIAKLIPNVSLEAQDVIIKLISYSQDQRMSAGQALKHSYFKEVREADKTYIENPLITSGGATGSQMSGGMMRLTHRGADSMS